MLHRTCRSARKKDADVPLRANSTAHRARPHAIIAAGGRPLIVGGAVRDTMLYLPAKVSDIEVYGLSLDALEAALRAVGPVVLAGRRSACSK